MVHITSGVSALVCALYLGKRSGYPKEPMKPHSLVLSVIGACLLWVGWFGFNAGSALAANALATSAFVATHFGAAAATLGGLSLNGLNTASRACSGGNLGSGRGTGRNYAGFRFCEAAARHRYRVGGRRGLLPDGHRSERPGSGMTIRWTPSACTARAELWARS